MLTLVFANLNVFREREDPPPPTLKLYKAAFKGYLSILQVGGSNHGRIHLINFLLAEQVLGQKA